VTLARRPELDQLIREIAAHPEHDQHRSVLIDLLAGLGEPCAALFAQARAGQPISKAKRSVAFGPLAGFFRSIELQGGLPDTATIARGVSVDQLAAVVSDARSGLLRRVVLSDGSRERYTQLIAAKELVGLQMIDASDGAMLSAALVGGHHITHLYSVAYYDRALNDVLARRDFDSVRHLEIGVVLTEADALMTRIIDNRDGIYARVPRHLVLLEPSRSVAFARSVFAAFPSFPPLTSAHTQGVTLRREADRIVASCENEALRSLLLEVLPESLAGSRAAPSSTP